jgi:hypothetical protein
MDELFQVLFADAVRAPTTAMREIHRRQLPSPNEAMDVHNAYT